MDKLKSNENNGVIYFAEAVKSLQHNNFRV